jgi:hypothetical protein
MHLENLADVMKRGRIQRDDAFMGRFCTFDTCNDISDVSPFDNSAYNDIDPYGASQGSVDANAYRFNPLLRCCKVARPNKAMNRILTFEKSR